jgi:hypothetical protein
LREDFVMAERSGPTIGALILAATAWLGFLAVSFFVARLEPLYVGCGVCLPTATGWLFKLPPPGWIGLSFLVLAGVLALDGALKRRHKKLCFSLAGVGLSLVVAICLFSAIMPLLTVCGGRLRPSRLSMIADALTESPPR